MYYLFKFLVVFDISYIMYFRPFYLSFCYEMEGKLFNLNLSQRIYASCVIRNFEVFQSSL